MLAQTPTTNYIERSPDYTWRQVNLNGMGWVTGMVIHPTQKDLVYIRTDVGGVKKYNPELNKWVQLLNGYGLGYSRPVLPSMTIESIALSRQNVNDIFISIGSDSADVQAKGQIYKSGDQGKTWNALNLKKANGQNVSIDGNGEYRFTGERLQVHPTNPNIIFYGSKKDGLFRSTSGGQNWQVVLQDQGQNGYVGFNSVAIDPTDPNQIYASFYQKGIFKSTNGGNNWAKVNEVPNYTIQQNEFDSQGNYIATMLDNNTGGSASGALFRFNKSSSSWQNISPTTYNYSGDGIRSLGVNPTDPNHIIVYSRNRQIFGNRNNIHTTRDGGITWTHQEVSYSAPNYWLGLGQQEEDFATTDFIFDPHYPNSVYYINGYGVYKTENINEQRTQWNALMNGLEELVVNSVVSHPSGKLLVTGWDMHGFVVDNAFVAPQNKLEPNTFGRLTSIAYSQNNPEYIYYAGSPQFSHTQLTKRSIDGGQTWSNLANLPEVGYSEGKIAVSNNNPNKLVYLPTNNPFYPFYSKAFYSNDGGSSWVASNGDLTGEFLGNGNYATTSLVADGSDEDTFYAFDCRAENGWRFTVYRTEDGGANWSEVYGGGNSVYKNQGEPRINCDNVGSMVAENGKTGTLWLSADNGRLALEFSNDNLDQKLFKSTDRGESWQAVSNVQSAALISLGKAVEGQSNPTMYMYGIIDGKEGIFRSSDVTRLSDSTQATWEKVLADNIGWGNTVTSIAADQNNFGRVFVGLAGQGVMMGDLTQSYELDSDSDGIPDIIEKGLDINNPIDTDGDGVPDYLDLDSDNDGIADSVEKGLGCQSKTNCYPTHYDGDTVPDYLDTDSDADGVYDVIEGWDSEKNGTNYLALVDTNVSTIQNFRDTNGNGLDDRIQEWGCNKNRTNLSCMAVDTTPSLQDTNKNGIPDYRDSDDDGDGLSTRNEIEGGNHKKDTSGNGTPDYLDPTNGDQLLAQSVIRQTLGPVGLIIITASGID